jgi:CRISPR/Cas system-associated exonuclease Cas4 (RecB family)
MRATEGVAVEDDHDKESEGLPSGSAFDSCFRCPGKWQLEKKCRKRVGEDPDARTGKRIHDALAENDFSKLTRSERITAQMCMNLEGALIERFNFEGYDNRWEKRLWMHDPDDNKIWSVKPDYVILSRERAMVHDEKTGRGIPVRIESNWQIASEAAAVWFWHRPTQVITCLIHPHHPDTQYEVKLWTEGECAHALIEINARVQMIQQPNQPRIPNSISCQYCRAKGICPEFQALTTRMADDIRKHWNDEGLAYLLDKDPVQRAEHVGQIKVLQKELDEQMRSYKKLLAKDPRAIAHHRLKRSYMTDITDEEQAIEIVEMIFGEDALAHSVKFDLKGLEDYLTTKYGRKQAEQLVSVHLGELIKRRAKEPSIERTK